ncbi:putative nicotinate-nucleotide pyrophosphorylase [Clostridium pasteurianum DSM 525 = ATCC 6013]|uniref:Probable nicotinate-nucleotide pyrophosphorylase [carboxylating] n=1 Tax=Clostridium pasteurianum DSM 525 = ATCC 6013 TaxID=1262449 RepID=A0A0H3IZ74_CLOPA|nr:carboxylating nicotinate-nucleotide diphosphorylase [Clostridium pasteurianum]AJA46334.1 putative nicotinate-nucleotide pyrophosphorylase [Clostridium pasteurianum DSM 525 = ATCC 6013]AJA50322.1 putative nicotinate-nucleotide pyrophosphorylase [Clostridium pasteurianum DSM 525 = ATCC 6013]AOZ73776.1 nicotinate-nucleotide pyrophosphorylase [Clostridium pasteurianum DSM 525 = ATCC 6013]AOZ77573.1 nicotinate-nucleotide pyrophosphorylase [Clostridium pasteurianum]ELP60911.1 nicotinate-nucleotid
MNSLIIDNIIIDALKEDGAYDDITTNSIVNTENRCKVDLIVKEDGILCGTEVFKRVFEVLGGVSVEFYAKDGDNVKNGQVIAEIKGSTSSVLSGERVALNILQRMSGIATLTNKFIEKLQGTKTKLLDTRKTTPNLRVLERYAVKIGGGENHRYNLSDGVLIKDNHIAAAGGIKNAIEMTRKNVSFVKKIEVETETLEQVKEAVSAKADVIMLDNMKVDTIRKALDIINGGALTEVSGNVDLETIRSLAETGVDYISTGYVTHSYKVLDLSMKNLTLI